MYLTNRDSIKQFIKEDVPYFDLTGHILKIGDQPGRMQFICRNDAVICGVEEVLAIFEELDIRPLNARPSGTLLQPGNIFLEAEGPASSLHTAWKPAQNMLEYCSGIATRTHRMVERAHQVNPNLSILTTRKIFPGTKELAIKAVLAGGGYPHRLGLSESILIFKQHIQFLGGFEALERILPQIKQEAVEKKITVEVENIEDALKAASWGADSIQFDKLDENQLREAVVKIRERHPHILLIAAGGIHENNVAAYASSGIDAIVTTAAYFGKPVDIGVNINAV